MPKCVACYDGHHGQCANRRCGCGCTTHAPLLALVGTPDVRHDPVRVPSVAPLPSTEGQLACPECAAAGQTFTAIPRALGSHRRYKHGVRGSS